MRGEGWEVGGGGWGVGGGGCRDEARGLGELAGAVRGVEGRLVWGVGLRVGG